MTAELNLDAKVTLIPDTSQLDKLSIPGIGERSNAVSPAIQSANIADRLKNIVGNVGTGINKSIKDIFAGNNLKPIIGSAANSFLHDLFKDLSTIIAANAVGQGKNLLKSSNDIYSHFNGGPTLSDSERKNKFKTLNLGEGYDKAKEQMLRNGLASFDKIRPRFRPFVYKPAISREKKELSRAISFGTQMSGKYDPVYVKGLQDKINKITGPVNKQLYKSSVINEKYKDKNFPAFGGYKEKLASNTIPQLIPNFLKKIIPPTALKNAFNLLPQPVKGAAANLILFTAALKGVGKLLVIGSVISGILLFGKAILSLARTLQKMNGDISASLAIFSARMLMINQTLGSILAGPITKFLDSLATLFESLVIAGKPLIELLGFIIQLFASFINGLTLMIDVVGLVTNAISTVVKLVYDALDITKNLIFAAVIDIAKTITAIISSIGNNIAKGNISGAANDVPKILKDSLDDMSGPIHEGLDRLNKTLEEGLGDTKGALDKLLKDGDKIVNNTSKPNAGFGNIISGLDNLIQTQNAEYEKNNSRNKKNVLIDNSSRGSTAGVSFYNSPLKNPHPLGNP